MVRFFGPFVGLGFCTALVIAFVYSIIGIATAESENPVNTTYYWHEEARAANLQSDGPFGSFDRQQVQRGMQVFREVCAACHSLNQVHFRDFADLGYNEDEVKAIAAGWPIQSPSINAETGEAATRAPTPPDRIPSPYANEVAARAANNNALPPDLSLIVKAREGGADYIYSLLTGYRNVPANLPRELRPGQGLHYNPYFHSLNIAMAPPLTSAGQVTYAAGEGQPEPTVRNMARDVTAFLVWTAEPELQQRHRAGYAVLAFLLAFTLLTFFSYQAIWADKKRK
jgi:ubiquinol-cytochrome c reductase cytochrome c1 subunit